MIVSHTPPAYSAPSLLFNEITPTINADDTKGGSWTFSLTLEARVGKKYAIYLLKAIVQALNLKEGAKVLLRVKTLQNDIALIQSDIAFMLARRGFLNEDERATLGF